MNKKISLIIQREYLTRVRKRSFIIMSILGPLFIAAIFIVPLLLEKLESEQIKNVAVIDDSFILANTLKDTDMIKFHLIKDMKVDEFRNVYSQSNYYALLYIPENILNSKAVQLFSDTQPDFGLKILISKILEKDLETLKLIRSNVDPELLKAIRHPIRVATIKWTEDGQEVETTAEVKTIIGIVAAMLIYAFIFMFGMQVMRGVIEEKVNRIVEVIISSVKPIQLMIGKIVGIGAVGLTQFILWIVTSFIIISIAQYTLFGEEVMPSMENQTAQVLGQEQLKQQIQSIGQDEFDYAINVFDSVRNVNWAVMFGAFLMYFIFGYLLYAAMYAGVGSAVDNETDTQQFMLPITLPLIISLVMIQIILHNPDGSIAFWMSMIPFTSPIAMMARIPFGVPYWQFILSITILIGSFIAIAFGAAKVYRIGILIYGKKVSYSEIFKWLRKR